MHIVQKYLDMESEISRISRLEPIELNINTDILEIGDGLAVTKLIK